MSIYHRVEWKPLDTWPGEYTTRRQRSRFDSTLGTTLVELDRELRALNARQCIIEADLTNAQIRLSDGWPRAKSKVPPPIKLSFESKHGPLAYATDRFDHWHDNLRAIALGLEALRKVDRYGISDHGQQYAGWAALPSAGGSTDVAATIIAEAAHMPLDAVLADPKGAVRQAQIRTHPDRGGNADDFQRVTEAADVLTRHKADSDG